MEIELADLIRVAGAGQLSILIASSLVPFKLNFKRDLASLLIVEDVRYRPRWSWEVEQVGEFALDNLPADTSASTLRWIDALRDSI